MKRAIGIFVILGIGTAAMALTAFSTVFVKTYNIPKDSNLGSHPCLVCHLEVKPKNKKGLNKYGLQVQTEMKAQGVKKVNADVLKAVEDKSATGGKSNMALIKADKFPGGNAVP